MWRMRIVKPRITGLYHIDGRRAGWRVGDVRRRVSFSVFIARGGRELLLAPDRLRCDHWSGPVA
jgi:hypothetical protein